MRLVPLNLSLRLGLNGLILLVLIWLESSLGLVVISLWWFFALLANQTLGEFLILSFWTSFLISLFLGLNWPLVIGLLWFVSGLVTWLLNRGWRRAGFLGVGLLCFSLAQLSKAPVLFSALLLDLVILVGLVGIKGKLKG